MPPLKRKKRSRLLAPLLLVLFLLLAGAAGLVVWLYRGDVGAIFRTKGERVRPGNDGEPMPEIREEERRQLEEILKQRG